MFRNVSLVLLVGVILFGVGVSSGAQDDPLAPPHAERLSETLPTGAVQRLGSAPYLGSGLARGLVVLPGGEQLITADSKDLILWEIASGRRLATVPGPVIPRGAQFLDGTRVGTELVVNENELIVVRAGRVYQYPLPLKKGEPHQYSNPSNTKTHKLEGIIDAAFAGQDQLFALTGTGRLLERKSIIKERISWIDTRLPPVTGPNMSLVVGGDIVAIGGKEGKVRLWDAVNRKILGEIDLAAEASFTLWMALSADGKYLATLSGTLFGEKQLRVWTVADRKEVRSWKCVPTAARLALSPDGTVVACGMANKTIELYEAKTGKLLHTLAEADDKSQAMEFLPDGSKLIAAGKSGVVRQWDVKTGKPVGPFPVGHSGSVNGVVSTKDGRWITAGEDRTAILWSADGKPIRKFEGHTQAITSMVLSADGKTLFTAGLDCTVRAWDVEKGTELRHSEPKQLQRVDVAIQSLALSPDGKTLALGVGRGKVRLLDSATMKSLALLEGVYTMRGGWTDAVAFIDNKRLLSRSGDHTLHIWDIAKGEELHRLPAYGFGNQRARVAVSPDGKQMVSPLGREKTPRLEWTRYVGVWDTESGKLLHGIDIGALTDLTAVAFTPDGKSVVVGEVGGAVWVIDLEKKAVRQKFGGHRGPVHCLAVSPDGKTVASGGADTTAIVWDLTKQTP